MKYSFEIAPSRKEVLLNGLDDIGTSLLHVDENRTRTKRRNKKIAPMYEAVDVKHYSLTFIAPTRWERRRYIARHQGLK